MSARLKNAEKVILMYYETEAQKIIISMKKIMTPSITFAFTKIFI